MKRQSLMMSKQLEFGEPVQSTNFSLVLCEEWEKKGNSSFFDLVELVKCGIPSNLRTVVWSDLMKANLIEIEEKKYFLKHYPQKFSKQISTFENLCEICQKYDSVAFRQIDQDINNFKFPAYYFQESLD